MQTVNTTSPYCQIQKNFSKTHVQINSHHLNDKPSIFKNEILGTSLNKNSSTVQGLPTKSQAGKLLQKLTAIHKMSKITTSLLMLLFEMTQSRDWIKDGFPCSWPSNGWLADELNCSVRAIQKALNFLEHEAGLLERTTQGERHGKRVDNPNSKDHRKIIETEGIDFTILITRYAELQALCLEYDQRVDERSELKKELCRARKAIYKKCKDSHCKDDQNQLAKAEQVYQKYRRSRDKKALLEAIKSLLKIQNSVDSASQDYFWQAKSSWVWHPKVHGWGELSFAHNLLKESLNDNLKDVLVQEASPPEPDIPCLDEPEEPKERVTRDESLVTDWFKQVTAEYKISPCMMIFIFTMLGCYPTDRNWHSKKTWSSVMACASIARQKLGITDQCWKDALKCFGGYGASLVIASVLDKQGEIRNNNAYFSSLIDLGYQGKLDIGRSIAGMRRRYSERAGGIPPRHVQIDDSMKSTRDMTLEEDLNDHSWAD